MHRSITMAGLFSSFLLVGLAAAQAQHRDAAADAPVPPEQPVSERARARYPQPVRVGDLAGRLVLEDVPEQRVIGRVAAVTRDTEGHVQVLVDCCGVFGFGVRRVALPVEAMTLLGQFMVVLGHDGAALRVLPEAAAPIPATVLPPRSEIRVGLGRN